jgi:aspartate/methionine/tyrosine aminotransferase
VCSSDLDVVDGSGAFPPEQLAVTAFAQIDRLRSRARAILSANIALVRDMVTANQRLEWLEPAAGTTAFPRVRGVDDTAPLVDRLIAEHDTVVVPGHFFQAPEHIRISFGGRREMLAEGLSRLAKALES